ncbi:hypothetical protein MKEN_01319100 [Mycena kentingensis (nom. inval.)]|nr:hypothetical protein MKEN_01319100 [Mycena kentingensis (nom. inval.)]
MALLNRPPEFNRLYDSEGRLQGGLGALEDLARVIAVNNGDEQDRDAKMGSTHDDIMGSEDEPGSSDDDSVTMEELNMVDNPPFPISAPSTVAIAAAPRTAQLLALFLPRPDPRAQPEPAFIRVLPKPRICTIAVQLNNEFALARVPKEYRAAARGAAPSRGPIQTAVYRAQRRIDVTRSLMRRIVEGQRMNDAECAKPKSVRLGFMGHLTLIAEDVLTALERFPTELRNQIASFAPQPDWDEYVQGRYNETKRRDAELLGGGKPVIKNGMGAGAGAATARWKVDEEDAGGATATLSGDHSAPPGMEMSFRRASSARPRREGSADFGSAPMMENDDAIDGMVASHRIEYASNPDNFDSDHEGGGGWLSQSAFFVARPARVKSEPQLAAETARIVRATSVLFVPLLPNPSKTAWVRSRTPGADPFTCTSPASGSPSAFSNEMDDSGDFVSPPKDEELTPTAGSWTFASQSGESLSPSPREKWLEPEDLAEAAKRISPAS